MTRLSYLHEPGVLWNLQCRYRYDDIYTYTGTILIAVNPFANLDHLYGTHMMDEYRGKPLGELSPHVYAIADAAYRQMREEWKGQSILVRVMPAAGAPIRDLQCGRHAWPMRWGRVSPVLHMRCSVGHGPAARASVHIAPSTMCTCSASLCRSAASPVLARPRPASSS